MTQEQILGVVRHGLTLVGGFLITKGLLDESSVTELSGAILSIITVIWSVTSKKK